jgi:deazaflavin-dependent oxidoreductase (nitroreductase family)
VARFNKRVTNRLALPLVPHLPGFGVIEHTGRRTGQCYRTPVLAFRRGVEFVIALTYGPQTDWVRNVLAAGGGCLVRDGRRLQFVSPRLVHAELRRPVPGFVALVLRMVGVSDFLFVRPAS